jgi:hypothetical protein
MATFTNATTSKLSLGKYKVAPSGTITDVNKDEATLTNIKYFYDKGYLTTTDTPYFTSGGIEDALVYKGVINCSANPNYPAANAGHLYKVSAAGKIGGASGTVVEVGDMIVCTNDDTVTGTQAAVGAYWTIEQGNVVAAVTGPTTAVTDTNMAAFDGTTGKIIKDSGKALAEVMVFKGTIACVGEPNYPAAVKGDTYKVSSAGKIGGASGTSVSAGEIIVCTAATSAAGDEAAVGANWV